MDAVPFEQCHLTSFRGRQRAFANGRCVNGRCYVNGRCINGCCTNGRCANGRCVNGRCTNGCFAKGRGEAHAEQASTDATMLQQHFGDSSTVLILIASFDCEFVWTLQLWRQRRQL
jgi:hypothetical protein